VPVDAAPEADLGFVFVDAEPSVLPAQPDTSAFDARLALYAHAVPRAGKSIGHTSIVFRLDFATDAGSLRAAYKPESKRGHKRYRGEVAAYRLAKALHIANVPPATVRVFDRASLAAFLGGGVFDDEVIDHGGRVYGALMPWIDKLEFIGLEAPAERARWKKALQTGADIPETDRAQVAQISNLIVFDCLTGNWDRWSGAQIGIERVTGALLFVDNDAAFFDPIPPAFNAQMALLKGIDRFSRALVDRVRHLDALALADALGEEEPGTPLLAPRVLAAADDRRKAVLAEIDRKISAFGDPAVLFFP
jgi:hypothetical protein